MPVLALSIVALVAGMVQGAPRVAWTALAVFGVATLADEFGFHRMLSRRERGVHFAAWAALALFVVAAHRWGALG